MIQIFYNYPPTLNISVYNFSFLSKLFLVKYLVVNLKCVLYKLMCPGLTALDWAILEGNTETAEILRENGKFT